MIEELTEILKMDIETIISSRYSLTLLKLYSTLFLAGGQPRTCAKSQRHYFSQLKKTGMEKAKNLGLKTCICKNKGIVHFTALQKHINLELINDNDATILINAKVLKLSDFEKLPEAYDKKPKVEEKTEQIKETKKAK